MKYVYKVWCEWDIGLNEVVFMTEEGAWEAAENAITELEESLEELKDNGLIDIERWDICE